MRTYHNLLIVANHLTKQDIKSLSQYIKESRIEKSHIHLVFVLPSIPACYFHIPSVYELQNKIKQTSILKLKLIRELLHLEPQNSWLLSGNFKSCVNSLSYQIDSDKTITSAKDLIQNDENYLHNYCHLFLSSIKKYLKNTS